MKNKRTYKKIIKSLYNAACIAETISALEEKASIITENMLFYNCVEEEGFLYKEDGSVLASIKRDGYYEHVTLRGFPSDRFYKLNEKGLFLAVSSWAFVDEESGYDNGFEPLFKEEFLRVAYRLAVLENKRKKIMKRECVDDYLDGSYGCIVGGFQRNCTVKNGVLYNAEGEYLAEGQHDNFGLTYYVNQGCGFCEDDYFGEIYLKVSDGLFIIIAYSS